MAMREELVQRATMFLSSDAAASVSLAESSEFLQRAGLTPAEVNEARLRLQLLDGAFGGMPPALAGARPPGIAALAAAAPAASELPSSSSLLGHVCKFAAIGFAMGYAWRALDVSAVLRRLLDGDEEEGDARRVGAPQSPRTSSYHAAVAAAGSDAADSAADGLASPSLGTPYGSSGSMSGETTFYSAQAPSERRASTTPWATVRRPHQHQRRQSSAAGGSRRVSAAWGATRSAGGGGVPAAPLVAAAAGFMTNAGDGDGGSGSSSSGGEQQHVAAQKSQLTEALSNVKRLERETAAGLWELRSLLREMNENIMMTNASLLSASGVAGAGVTLSTTVNSSVEGLAEQDTSGQRRDASVGSSDDSGDGDDGFGAAERSNAHRGGHGRASIGAWASGAAAAGVDHAATPHARRTAGVATPGALSVRFASPLATPLDATSGTDGPMSSSVDRKPPSPLARPPPLSTAAAAAEAANDAHTVAQQRPASPGSPTVALAPVASPILPTLSAAKAAATPAAGRADGQRATDGDVALHDASMRRLLLTPQPQALQARAEAVADRSGYAASSPPASLVDVERRIAVMHAAFDAMMAGNCSNAVAAALPTLALVVKNLLITPHQPRYRRLQLGSEAMRKTIGR